MSFVKILSIGAGIILAVNLSAFAGNPGIESGGNVRGGLCKLKELSSLDSVPWPWGEEADMPWEMLDGTWRVVNGNCQSLFSFETTGKELEPSARVLNVVQYDTLTCEKSSWGYGVEVDRVMQASMTTGKATFNLTVRADHRSPSSGKAKKPPRTPGKMPYIVLTMYSKAGWHIRQSYELQKVSREIKPACQRAKNRE